jgi:hypothetical protein
MEISASILATGIGATLLTDLWGWLRQPLLGVPSPDYGLVGRWLAHMRHGRFRHVAIARSPAVGGERLLGWVVHYAIGIGFAALLYLSVGAAWFAQPTLAPALGVGLATVAAPFLLMQPAMGAGIAASRTPRPAAARVNTLILHGVFGAALYVSGMATRLALPV